MWLIFVILSVIFGVAYSLLMRFTLKEKGDPKIFTIILDFTIAIVLLLLMPFEDISYLFNVTNLLVISLVIIGTAVVAVLFVIGRQLEEASNVTIGAQIGGIWNLVGAALILGEPLTIYKIAGAGLILAGNFLVFFKKGQLKLSKGMIAIIIGSIIFSTNTIGDKYLLGFFSPALYNFILYSMSTIILFFVLRADFKKIKGEVKLHGPVVFLIGCMFGLMIFFFEKAIKLWEVSRVSQLHNLSIILTVILGIILLKEKDNLIKKIIAAVMVFIGAYLLII